VVAAEKANANADAETEPAPPKSPDSLEVVPGPASISQRRPRRSRKTLTLLLPLLLVLGGTTGAVLAIAPWTTNSASGSDNGTDVVATGTSSGVSDTATATNSLAPTASAKPSPSAKASSATPKKGSTTNTGSGGSGGSGGGTTKTTTPGSGGTKTTGPSGPGSDPALQSGSVVSVHDCEGWIDYSTSYFFKATVSAGNPAHCEESVWQDASIAGTSTTDISASNGGVNTDEPCGTCFFWGSWTISVKICVWNTAYTSDKVCSPEYTDNTGTVSEG
jgi:hypothetical protein